MHPEEGWFDLLYLLYFAGVIFTFFYHTFTHLFKAATIICFFLKNINSRGCELSLCTSIFKFSSSIHNSENLTFFILWHTYIYKNQGVRNVDFSKHFVCLTFRLDWDVCLIVPLLSSNYIPINTQAALNLHRISFDFQQFFTRQYNIILNFEKLF